MFISVTPIDQLTGLANGNPVWVNKANISYVHRISAGPAAVDHTVVGLCGLDETVICSDLPEVMFPNVVGNNLRD